MLLCQLGVFAYRGPLICTNGQPRGVVSSSLAPPQPSGARAASQHKRGGSHAFSAP